MPLSIRSQLVEGRARELARRTRASLTDAIGEALAARLAELDEAARKARAEIVAIAAECAAAPDLDLRNADDILGYGPEGAP